MNKKRYVLVGTGGRAEFFYGAIASQYQGNLGACRFLRY